MNLREMRKSRSLTSTGATARMGVTRKTITDLESTLGTRKVNISIISRIAKAYGYPITDVVYACVGEDKDTNDLYLDSYVKASSLKDLREFFGYTRLQLAKKLKVGLSSIRRLEVSEIKPHSHYIYALHRLYKVSCENIFDVCQKQFGMQD